MTDETTNDEELVVTAQATLPEFEGASPVAVVTKLNGAGQRIHRAMHLGEKVVLVVEAHVGNVGHATTDAGMKRLHTLRVDDIYELEGRRGSRLVQTLKKAYRLAEDARHGRKGLPHFDELEGKGDGIPVNTDASGVVLTDADMADLGLNDASNDPAVIVFDDGARVLWPDDWGSTVLACPDAGDRIIPPGGTDHVLVREVLDAHTGETLDSWSDEAEEARQLEDEQRAEAEEDRTVGDELEARRSRTQEHVDELDGAPADSAVPPVIPYPEWTAQYIVSWLTTSVDDPGMVEQTIRYESAHKGRSSVIKTAQARLRTLARDQADVPPLPGEGEEE